MALNTKKVNAFVAKMDALTAGITAKVVSQAVTASDGKAILASIDQASTDVVKVYSGLKRAFATKAFLSTAGQTSESKEVASILASLSNLGTRIDFLKTIAEDEFGGDMADEDMGEDNLDDVSADDVLDGIADDTGVSFDDLKQTIEVLQDQIVGVEDAVADVVDDPALLGGDAELPIEDAPMTDIVSTVVDPKVKEMADKIKEEIKDDVVGAEAKKSIVAKKISVPTTKSTIAGNTPSIGLFGSFVQK